MESHVYEPKYLMWWEKDFAADTYVSRVMRPLHRHFYRALIIASCFNSLRPYLPNDDGQLWILADAESLDQWMAHKDVVMRKFTLCPSNDNLWQHKRILADWELMLAAHNERSESGKKGGAKKASNAKLVPSSATAQPGSAIAPSSTMNLTMNLTEQNTTHTSACVNSFDQVAKYLDIEMLTSQWKHGEKEQVGKDGARGPQGIPGASIQGLPGATIKGDKGDRGPAGPDTAEALAEAKAVIASFRVELASLRATLQALIDADKRTGEYLKWLQDRAKARSPKAQ